MEVADEGGLGALTMRSLARHLSTKPMSLYHHVANKEDILDGVIDLVFAEIELPSDEVGWKEADGPFPHEPTPAPPTWGITTPFSGSCAEAVSRWR